MIPHFLKALPPKTIMLEAKISAYELVGGYKLQTSAPNIHRMEIR